jgi:DNA adenine methylase
MFWILQAYPNIERAVINATTRLLICTNSCISRRTWEELIAELAQIQEEYIPWAQKTARLFSLRREPVSTRSRPLR